MRLTRAIENQKYIIYERQRGHEKWIPRYFAYDKSSQEHVAEFKTITQARKFITTA